MANTAKGTSPSHPQSPFAYRDEGKMRKNGQQAGGTANKTRIEQAESRAEQAETRIEQSERTLQRVVHKEVDLRQEISSRRLKRFPLDGIADRTGPLEKLTDRQREILQLIAGGQNTKQIAELLKLSPKTVAYHPMKLMAGLNVHDIPGLIRFALRIGLIPQES